MMPHNHAWVPLKKGYEKCLVCACGAMHVRGIQVGDNTITLSPSGVGDVARWSATKEAVAAGDLGMSVTSGRPNVIVSGVVRPLIYTTEVVGGTFGIGMFGDGSDGNSTLVANTVFAANDNVQLYDNFTSGGFNLSANSADLSLVMYVKSTASISAGTNITATTFGAVGTGGAGGGPAGGGANGGTSCGTVAIYANTITGSGTVSANGTAGSVGGIGSATATANTGGVGGAAGSTNSRLFGIAFAAAAAAGVGAGASAGGIPGIGGTAGTVNALAPDVFQDCNRFMIGWGGTDGFTVGTDSNSRWAAGVSGGGGGGGSQNTAGGGGGGGGAGGGAFISNGGVGGGGGAAPGVSGTGSGGGGGGGTAGIAIVISNNTSAISVQANGGAGGAGGAAAAVNVTGGGGGGGASGGLSLVAGQSGHSAASSAAAGALGAGGTGTGPSGTSGAAGGAGIVFNSSWS
jgi:hypothetical protein